MDIIYREFKKDDIEQTVSFFKDLHEEGAGVSFSSIQQETEIEEWMKDPCIDIYVAEFNNEILGVFRGKKGNPGRDHSSFLTAAISKKHRGQKIGQNLTYYGLDKLKESGVKIARAYVYSNNASSVSALLKCGFTSSGCVHMHHYDEKINQYVDDLIFHKIL